ncbi:hypothetical protein HPB52_020216 [Rhipicephalus sanguineus]|uniref:Uncharacterized protein n=1 Tax=Rhipicephalus sanguineus TaxID=34632 RepID=A0A9D4PGI3_RHISA|nr:hypothetical protein HPB52_020216 [Rhipicephalus sanguineus]
MVVPSTIDSKRRLLELLEGVEGFDSAQRSSSENSTTDIFETVASLLIELSTAQENDNTPTIQLLAEEVFSESGPNALRVIGAQHSLKHYEETASFTDVIVRWWKVVNVKTPSKD